MEFPNEIEPLVYFTNNVESNTTKIYIYSKYIYNKVYLLNKQLQIKFFQDELKIQAEIKNNINNIKTSASKIANLFSNLITGEERINEDIPLD